MGAREETGGGDGVSGRGGYIGRWVGVSWDGTAGGLVGEREGYMGMAVWIESSSGVGNGFGKLDVVAAMASGRGRWGS